MTKNPVEARARRRKKKASAGGATEMLTFKADQSLAAALTKVPNRSEFIRNAVLKAFESSCPFCRGTGTMTMNQRRHWDAFMKRHRIAECDDCHEYEVKCASAKGAGRACGRHKNG